MKETADEAVADSAYTEHIVVVRRAGRDCPMIADRDVFWDELCDGKPAEARTEKTTAEDPFMIAYTSGTTGRPKGAVHVHGGFLVNIATEGAYQTDLHRDEILCSVSDLSWIMGGWAILGARALAATGFLYATTPNQPKHDRISHLA